MGHSLLAGAHVAFVAAAADPATSRAKDDAGNQAAAGKVANFSTFSVSSFNKDAFPGARSQSRGLRSRLLDNSLLGLGKEPLSSPESRRGKHFSVRCGMQSARDLVIQGKVKAYPPKEAGKLLSQNAAWRVLDVRPIWEKERAYIKDSVHAPYFIEDDDTGLLTLLKKQIQFGFGGWWLGQRLTKINENFLSDVENGIQAKDTTLIVACGEGLRSLLACEDLYEEGYENLVWLAGGLNNARDGDFQEVGETKLQFATAGGVQGILIRIGRTLAELSPKNA